MIWLQIWDLGGFCDLVVKLLKIENKEINVERRSFDRDLFANSNFHILVAVAAFNAKYMLPAPSFLKSWCYLMGRDHHYTDRILLPALNGWFCASFAIINSFHRHVGGWGWLWTAINEKKSFCFLTQGQFKKKLLSLLKPMLLLFKSNGFASVGHTQTRLMSRQEKGRWIQVHTIINKVTRDCFCLCKLFI